LAVLVGTFDLANAQGRPWERQVQDKLRQAVNALTEHGFELSGNPSVGLLLSEASDSFAVTLRAGHSYALIGVCDDDCLAVELELYGPGDKEVAAERATTLPIVRVTPPRDARYRVKVNMRACGMNPCWYGLAVVLETPAREIAPGSVETERLGEPHEDIVQRVFGVLPSAGQSVREAIECGPVRSVQRG
jgi:hypothetical protein